MNAQIAKGGLMNEDISFANEQPQRDFLFLFLQRKKKEEKSFLTLFLVDSAVQRS